MMTDRELLELAAKAAEVTIAVVVLEGGKSPRFFLEEGQLEFDGPIEPIPDSEWNPLTDDGDALRLAVKLGIGFSFGIEEGRVVASHFDSAYGEWERIDNDPYAATRRAIVRAAAEIGKGMK